MKTFLFTLFMLATIPSLFSQQTAVTKDGKTVILNDDGTWQYSVEIGGVKMPDSLLKKRI